MEYFVIIITGWAMGLIAAIPIGPVNLICIRRTIQFGRIHGFVSGLGAALGDGIFACIAAFSLTAISQLINGYSVPLQIIGGTMLMVIGLRMFFASPPPRMADQYGPMSEAQAKACATNGNGKNGTNGANCKPKSPVRGMATTFALTTTNPATVAWFFSGAAGLSGLSDMLSFFQASFWVIGVVLGSATWWLILTSAVGKMHAMINDKTVVKINRASGFLVSGFGLALLAHVAFPHLLR